MHGILFVVEFAVAVAAAAAAAAVAATTAIAADDEEDPVGLPGAATDMAADGGAAAIDIDGMGIRTEASEDALLLLVMVFVSSVPYSPIEPSRCSQVPGSGGAFASPERYPPSGSSVTSSLFGL